MASVGNITQLSPLVTIGTTVTETAANTFTESEVELPLSSLNRQVFVITDIEGRLDTPESPGIMAPATSAMRGQISKSTQTAMLQFGDSDVLWRANKTIYGDVGAMCYIPPEVNPRNSIGKLTEDYLDILASSNYFVAVEGVGQAAARVFSVKVTGYMAKVDADVYAALVVAEHSG